MNWDAVLFGTLILGTVGALMLMMGCLAEMQGPLDIVLAFLGFALAVLGFGACVHVGAHLGTPEQQKITVQVQR